MRRAPSILALSASAALLASAAQAQPPAPPSGGGGSGGPEQMHARWAAMRDAHARQHEEDLRIVLRLRPNQEAALQALLQVQAPPEPHIAPAQMTPPRAPMTTPQRLDEVDRREAERSQARARRLAALKAFYAALDPDQQRVFDALQRLQHGGPGDGRLGLHGPMGRGEGGPRGRG